MSDLPQPLPPKKDVALTLLEGPSAFVHVDPRRQGVVVPKWFTGQPQLVLQVGLNMAIPIPDLKVDDDGMSCTLSFNRAPFWCYLPWSSVFALVGEDGRGMVWPHDVPPEVAVQAQKPAAAAKPARKPRPKPALRDRTGDDVAAESTPDVEAARQPEPAPALALAPAKSASQLGQPHVQARKPRRELPPYLRVIK